MPPHLGMTDKLDFLEGDKGKGEKNPSSAQGSKKALNKKG